MPGNMYVPRDNGFQNQVFSLLSNVIMQKIAYDQQNELMSKRQKSAEEQQGKEIMFNAGMEGRDIVQTDAGTIPEGYIQNPYNTTQFIGPKPKESSSWSPVEYNGKVFGISNGKQVLNVPETWKQGDPLKFGNKTLLPQTNERTGEVKYKEVSFDDKNWGPKSMQESLAYYEQQKSIDAKYDLKKELSKDAKASPEKLRKEFIQQSKVFIGVQDAHRRVQASVKDPSAAGDLSLIFNYMKILDPGSTVREGEFATAANSQGVDDRIRTMYNKIMKGERLAPAARDDFFKRSNMLYDKQEGAHKQLISEYDRIAKETGVEPSQVIVNYIMPSEKQGSPSTSTGTLADEYIKKYGTR